MNTSSPILATPTEQKRRIKPSTRLPAGAVRESDYFVRRYTAKIPVSHTLKDIMAPDYFINHTDRLAKAHSQGPVKLEVISDDCGLHAEFMVLEARKNHVKLRLIQVYHDDNADADEPEDDRSVLEIPVEDRYSIQWGGPRGKHSHYRILDHGKIVAHSIISKEVVTDLVEQLNDGIISIVDISPDYQMKQEE